MKKFLALILSAVLLVGVLAGCGGDKAASDDGLEGTWRTEIDMADMINDQLAAGGMGEFVNISDFSITMVMDIKADGTYAMTVDKDALNGSMEGVKEDMKNGVIAYMENMIKEQGMDMSVEDAMAAANISLDDMIDQAFSEEAMDEMTANLHVEGQYKAEDGKFYTSGNVDEAPSDNYETYTLEGNTLTLDVSDAEVPSSFEQFLPMVFTRA